MARLFDTALMVCNWFTVLSLPFNTMIKYDTVFVSRKTFAF